MRSFATLFVSSIARGLKNLRGASIVLLTVCFALLAGCGGSTGGGVQPIQKTTPVITWPTPSAITYGTALSSTQLNATTTVAGSFVYSPAAGTVLTAGTQTLSVTFTPTDTTDYNTATGSVQLVVNKATPTITTWPTASAITYGAALSTSTLTGGVATGTFAWTAPSTVPAVGTDSESVAFTPTDATDYLSVIGSVPVVVNPATPQITNFTIAGGPYAVEDESSNAYLAYSATCAGCAIGDTFSLTEPLTTGSDDTILTSAATTITGIIGFNAITFRPTFVAVADKHAGGNYGGSYAAAFLGIGNQSTLAISPTGTALQIEPSTGQVDTRATDGTTGTLFAACTQTICEQSAVQIDRKSVV